MDNEKFKEKQEQLDHNDQKNSNNNENCVHEWKLLDLGTGDYSSSYCQKCNLFQCDLDD